MLSALRRRFAAREIAQIKQTFDEGVERLQEKVRELEAGNSQIEEILRSMAEGVLAVGAGGEILLINPAAQQILGVGPGAAAGAQASALIRQPEIQELIRKVLEKEEPQVRDLILYAPAERHLRVHATPCQAPAGRGAGALMVLHDITDLKRLEGLRRDFVANVSHELKTPLTVIQGAAETLLDRALADPKHGRQFVESISEEAARLHRLVEDLLTLAQVESRQAVLRKEPIALQAFLSAEVRRRQAQARARQVSLALEDASAGAVLHADRDQLAQAVGNLIDNALQYNRPGGRVTVRVSAGEGRCRIEVEDTGIGIPSEDLPRIFERFYRVDKARSSATGGTGLGLSIVKHIVEAHGGSLEVQSRPGAGTRFTLQFP